MKITDKNVELDIMKLIFLKNKEIDEKHRCLIKIEKPNAKLSNRILIIKEEEKSFFILRTFYNIINKRFGCFD